MQTVALRIALLSIAFLATPAFANPLPSCGAPAIGPDGEWSRYLLTSLSATEIRQEIGADGATWVNDSRWVGRPEQGDAGIMEGSVWNPATESWDASPFYIYLEYLDSGNRPFTLYETRGVQPTPQTNVPRWEYTFDANGSMTSWTKRDLRLIDGSVVLVDNRRNTYVNTPSGVFVSSLFERANGNGGWTPGSRVESTLNADGQRVLCEAFLSSGELAARFKSTYDSEGRLATVVREVPASGGNSAQADSTVLVYDAEGRYSSNVTYDRDSGDLLSRVVTQFDNQGHLI
ncbi:MAG: hypothetical protein AAGK21_09475 [Bacteroidota bacterium]